MFVLTSVFELFQRYNKCKIVVMPIIMEIHQIKSQKKSGQYTADKNQNGVAVFQFLSCNRVTW